MEPGWTTVACPATNLSILTCKSSARIKQSLISFALETYLEIRLGICRLYIKGHFCIDPMTIVVSHQAVPPHFTTKLRPCIYQSSLQCDVCIPSHQVIMSVTKRRASSPWKNFLPLWKMSWKYCIHNHCFRACYRCKIWTSLRKLFAPLVSKAGYGSAGDSCLVISVSYATQLSLFTITFFRFNIKF